jgi:uncharacterized membrane protein YciS (DUF1049 family)
MKKILIIVFILFLLIFTISCNAGAERYNGEENKAGFLSGLWHGVISFITFIISIFNKDVEIYEANNVGTLYDLGFILGIAIFYGSGSSGIKIKNKESTFKKYKSEIKTEIKNEILNSVNEWANESKEKSYEDKKNISEDIEARIKKDLEEWED